MSIEERKLRQMIATLDTAARRPRSFVKIAAGKVQLGNVIQLKRTGAAYRVTELKHGEIVVDNPLHPNHGKAVRWVTIHATPVKVVPGRVVNDRTFDGGPDDVLYLVRKS